MNWKDYFYFTKTERNGIVVLVILILLIVLFPLVYPLLVQPKVYEYEEFREKVDNYEQLLGEYYEARKSLEKEKQLARSERSSFDVSSLFEFNPNELTLDEFLTLGLPERIARNIVNYRNAGGTFRFREDLLTIYTIDPSLYNQLEEYILLPHKTEQKQADKTRETGEQKSDESQSHSPVRGKSRAKILIDINLSDTTEWQQIRGIGPVFSRRITSYRELLGGYYSIDQLLEVYGMDSTRFEQIRDYIKTENIQLRKLNLNTDDFATLLRHPYLNKNQVNSIIQMRRRHGEYQSVEQIKQSALIDEQDFEKVAPYLTISSEQQQE